MTRVATLICNLTRAFLEFNETFTKIRFNHNQCHLLHMRRSPSKKNRVNCESETTS